MKLNCTTEPLKVDRDGNVASADDVNWLASFMTTYGGGKTERDANANLFALAPDMLQLLIDQQALRDGFATLTYDEAVSASLELNSRGEALLAKLKELGVVE